MLLTPLSTCFHRARAWQPLTSTHKPGERLLLGYCNREFTGAEAPRAAPGTAVSFATAGTAAAGRAC
ncbi:rCG53873 [Rattus norvegicus]|uniref:RCG53873 n=1 Tax=Rattus norvegicus TaxID=10116 RepID=A6J9W0_RAT|nr:rCG53873 [Rattus norvegicus]